MTTRRPGVRVAVLTFAAGSVVVVAAVLAGLWAANRTGEVARQQARSEALAVARRTAAVINASMERNLAVFADIVSASGIDRLQGPEAASQCQPVLAPLTATGYSVTVDEPSGVPVCTAFTTIEEGPGDEALGSVRAWVASRSDWERLGPLYEPRRAGRMSLAPDGRFGTMALAVPGALGRTAAVWIDSAVYFAGPMGVALTSPGVDTALVVDDRGRVVIEAAELRAGQPADSQARPVVPGRSVADPQGQNPVHAQVSRLTVGVDTGIAPHDGPGGGPARADGVGNWVTAPIPRLPAHVAVAYDRSGAAQVQAAARRNGLIAAAAVGAVALVVLFALWLLISRPLGRLASAVRSAGSRGPFSPPGGIAPDEVRSLSDAFAEYSRARDDLGEVVAAARERERARVVEQLTDEVAQSVSAASLLVRTDPEAAARHLRSASTGLARVTAELDPLPLPAGGVGAALAESVGRRWDDRVRVEDRSDGRRLDPVVERLLYRCVLEVLDDVAGGPVPADDEPVAGGPPTGAPGPVSVVVAVQPTGEGLGVSVTAVGGGPCAALDDPAYHDRHEFTAGGGVVSRSVSGDRRRLTLSVN